MIWSCSILLVMCRSEEDSMLHIFGFAVLPNTFAIPTIECVVNRQHTLA